MGKMMIRCISIVLTLTFITTQAFALAPSLVSDDIVPSREGVKNGIADTAQPGAIGDGPVLVGLLNGELFTGNQLRRLTPEEGDGITDRLKDAIELALDKTREAAKAEHREKIEAAVINLYKLLASPNSMVYLYEKAIVNGQRDYLVGFSRPTSSGDLEYAGLALDFINWLYSNYPPELAKLRLAQYIFHECVTEKLLIANGGVERNDHRAIYKEIQTPIFGAEEVSALGRDIREFINFRLGIVTPESVENPNTSINGPPTSLQFKDVPIPADLAKALHAYKLQPIKVEALQLSGKGQPIEALNNESTFAVGASISQAIGSILFAGQGKDIKEVADGNAVHFTERSIQYFTEANPKIAIVILADEGARDLSFSLDIGSIYLNGRKISFTGMDSLSDDLEEIRSKKSVQILYFIGDALEKTNGLIVPEAINEPTDSTSLFSFFVEDPNTTLDGKKRFLINDNFRIAGISFEAPTDAEVSFLDLPSVALSKIARAHAKARGINVEDPEALAPFVKNFINTTTILTLGPRPKGQQKEYESDIARHRHQAIISDARDLQQQYSGLQIQLPGDGDFLPRVIASLWIDLDGRHLIVFGRSGSAEATAASIVAANLSNARFVHSFVSSDSTGNNLSVETARAFTPKELARYSELGIPESVFKAERSKPEGQGIVAVTSVTGASPGIFGKTFANLFQRVTFERVGQKGGLAITNTLLVTPEGAFIVRVTFETPDLEHTKYDIEMASHIAREYKRKRAAEALVAPQGIEAQSVSELLNNIKDTTRVTEDSVTITVPTRFIDKTVDYLAFEAGLSQNPDVKAAAQRILREAALSFDLKLASIHDFYMAKQKGKWSNVTVPAVNGRADVYNQFQQLFRAAREKGVGALILELARSEMRYSAQDAAEFTAISIASAIKQGYKGLIFAQGDHYQVNKEKYAKGGDDREKELRSIEALIRQSVLAGKYNIDLDPSTLVDEAALENIMGFEKAFVDRYLKEHVELLAGLDENGTKSLRRRLVDEIEMGKIKFLTDEERGEIESLYKKMHETSAEVTMRFIRYIRALEKELGLTKPISIGVEERHIDNPKHKNNPSTVLGSVALMNTVLDRTKVEGLVGPSKISLQTGTMHGVGGKVDFGIYQRHLEFWQSIGVAVFVQHGASTLEKQDFDKMKEGDVGEVHLATEYQKIELDVVSRLLPLLGEEMAQFLTGMMDKDAKMNAKFRPMWELAFGNPEPAIASIKADDTNRENKIAVYTELAKEQSSKEKRQIINEILGDKLPKGLKGTLKDLTKELPGPFKRQLWNLPKDVRAAVDQALYEEFLTILEKLGASNTKPLIEQILPFNEQPVILPPRPEALQKAAAAVASLPIVAGIDDAMKDIKLLTDGLTLMTRKPNAQATDLSKFVVIMKKDLPMAVTGAKNALVSEALGPQYQVMKQNLRHLFTNDNGVEEVATREDLQGRATELIAKGFKVIVLDDGTLTQGLNETGIRGKKGEEYCVITTDAIENLDPLEIPFINLNAMAMMGVGVLHNDVNLFRIAYKIFTGKEAPQNLIDNLARKILWIIKALPRIVKITSEIGNQEKVRKLFEAAA